MADAAVVLAKVGAEQPPEPSWVREQDEPPEPASPASLLQFHDLGAVARAIDAAPPPRVLVRGLIPSDAYGVLASEAKAGKTWIVIDLAVAVAGNGSFLGAFPVETPGPVVLFLGEGGPRKMLRRIRAVADFYDVDIDSLPIRLCFRAPHLSNDIHLALIAEELAKTKPALTVVDPLYLAARGAQGSQLYEMGAVLEGVQHLCQVAGSALLVAHHYNRVDGKGARRLSGAGPAEWGRVIITAEVVSKRTDPESSESTVVMAVDMMGDEIADAQIRLRRKVAAVDPDDLSSQMLYSVEVLPGDVVTSEPAEEGMRPAHRRVLAALDRLGDWATVGTIGDALAVDDSGRAPLKARTIQDALKVLADAGRVESQTLLGSSGYRWRVVRSSRPEDRSEAENAF